MAVAYKKPFAAEIYKTFLHCAAKILRDAGGAITAYDGDRVMAVFIGNPKNTPAARAALKINYAMTEIVRPALKRQYPNDTYDPKHVVGIDTSELFIARTGVRVQTILSGSAAPRTMPQSSPHFPKRTQPTSRPTSITG